MRWDMPNRKERIWQICGGHISFRFCLPMSVVHYFHWHNWFPRSFAHRLAHTFARPRLARLHVLRPLQLLTGNYKTYLLLTSQILRLQSVKMSAVLLVRFQVLTAASIKTCFWDVAPCSLMEVDRRFRGVSTDGSSGRDNEVCTQLWYVGLLPLHGATSQEAVIKSFTCSF
jgi:hypothetical protein